MLLAARTVCYTSDATQNTRSPDYAQHASKLATSRANASGLRDIIHRFAGKAKFKKARLNL